MALEKSPLDKLNGFFLGLIRSSFGQLGMRDQQIVEYVASVLSDFSHTDRWLAIRNAEGRRLSSVVEMMLAQIEPDSKARLIGERALRKYVGDYTLFMSGLFRKHVERCGYLNYYLEEGKRAYLAVSTLDVSLYRPGFLVFEELGKGFEHYSGALDYMRKCCFHAAANQDPFAGFFEQIEGWVRLNLSEN